MLTEEKKLSTLSPSVRTSPPLPLSLPSLIIKQIAMQCLDKVAARPGAAASNGARGGASLIPAVGAAPPPQASSSAPSSTASQRARLTYTCDRHLFNFLAEPGPAGLTFCAVSPESAGRALPFAFLERVAADFHSRTESAFSPASLASAPAHALDRAFGPRLALAADFVAQHPESASKVASVQRQVDAVRDVMVENIERVLERGERIELLVDKTDGLRDQAARFQASGRALRQRMWWNVSRWFFFCFFFRSPGKGKTTRSKKRKTFSSFFLSQTQTNNNKTKLTTEHEDAADGRGADRLPAARCLRLRVLLRRQLPVLEEELKESLMPPRGNSLSLFVCFFFSFRAPAFVSRPEKNFSSALTFR